MMGPRTAGRPSLPRPREPGLPGEYDVPSASLCNTWVDDNWGERCAVS
jgi:hypothetical protein